MNSTLLAERRHASTRAPLPTTAIPQTHGHTGRGPLSLVRRLIRKEDFSPDDFVIAGSARLLVEGMVKHITDLDLVARGETLDRAFALARTKWHGRQGKGKVTGDRLARLYLGKINVSEKWLGGAPTDELIDNAEVIDGLRFLSVRDVLAYKLDLSRRKDRRVLNALELNGR